MKLDSIESGEKVPHQQRLCHEDEQTFFQRAGEVLVVVAGLNTLDAPELVYGRL